MTQATLEKSTVVQSQTDKQLDVSAIAQEANNEEQLDVSAIAQEANNEEQLDVSAIAQEANNVDFEVDGRMHITWITQATGVITMGKTCVNVCGQ